MPRQYSKEHFCGHFGLIISCFILKTTLYYKISTGILGKNLLTNCSHSSSFASMISHHKLSPSEFMQWTWNRTRRWEYVYISLIQLPTSNCNVTIMGLPPLSFKSQPSHEHNAQLKLEWLPYSFKQKFQNRSKKRPSFVNYIQLRPGIFLTPLSFILLLTRDTSNHRFASA